MTLAEYIIQLCEDGIQISQKPSVFPNQLDSETLFGRLIDVDDIDTGSELHQPDDGMTVQELDRPSNPEADNSENNMSKRVGGPNMAMDNSPTSNKYNLNNRPDFDHMSEDFCGTGSIGVGTFEPIKKKRKMKKTIKETAVDKPTGTPISDKSAKAMKFTADSTMKAAGKQWPRKHNETEAMCDVDEDGVEHESQGSHESTHGEPKDGYTTEVGHNWPNQPKLDGGTFEEFGNTLNGAEVGSSEFKENWSRLDIANGVSGMPAMQAMFDAYARSTDVVTVEDFNNICDLNGHNINIGGGELIHLIATNQQYVFHEMADSNGTYWIKTALNEESKKPWEKDEADDGDDSSEVTSEECEDDVCEGLKDVLRGRNILNEDQFGNSDFGRGSSLGGRGPSMNGSRRLNVGDLGRDRGGLGQDDQFDDLSLDHDGGLGGDEFGGDEFGGDDHIGAMGDSLDIDYSPEFGSAEGGMDDVSDGGLDDGFGDAGLGGSDFGSDAVDGGGVDPDAELGQYDRPETMGRPAARQPQRRFSRFESVDKFLTSAKNIIESSRGYTERDISEALNYAWETHIGHMDLAKCEANARNAIYAISRKYPNFQPMVTESEAMDNQGGTGLQSKSTKKSADGNETNMKEVAGGSLLKKNPKNDSDSTPTVKGTGTMSENIRRVAKQLTESIQANAKKLGGKKYNVKLTAVVKEGTSLKRSKSLSSINEAAAKIIELKKSLPKGVVKLEAVFMDGKNKHTKFIG